MTELFASLETILAHKNPNLYSHLNKGATHNEIGSYFTSFSINMSAADDLYELYKWHNGTIKNDENFCLNYCLFPDFYLLSLQEIKEILNSDYYYNFKIKRHIPIFRSCGGDYLSINIDECNSNKISKIYYCSPRVTNSMNYLSMFDSLKILFKCVLLCYSRDYYFISLEDKLLDELVDEVYQLNAEMNILSEYWNSEDII